MRDVPEIAIQVRRCCALPLYRSGNIYSEGSMLGVHFLSADDHDLHSSESTRN